MTRQTPTVVIIIGITGDLAQRKLLPAIGQLAQADVLPDQFKIVGITRQADVDKDSLVPTSGGSARFLREHLELLQLNLADPTEYQRLVTYLQTIDQQFGTDAQRLFYLSIPPQVSQSIIEHLGESGLAKAPNTKLLLEKPFGVDLSSAQDLVSHIQKYFSSEQVYRIDHYLAKEMAQNMLVFREENPLFRQTWNNEFIERITITASEQIGIEGRANFYDQTGALRDVVQSHLLQLAALTLAKPAHDNAMKSVAARRLEALKQLHLTSGAKQPAAVRGQYKTYAQEVSNPNTTTETFVSVTLQSDDPAWQGVPITIATGKALQEKSTEIRVQYKRNGSEEANELILRLQPNEGAELQLWTKRPGYEEKVDKRSLTFSYKEDERLPEAYERVFLDAIRSDHRLFASGEEVLETWHILDPLQRAWEMSDDSDLILYDAGADIFELMPK
jgi:glucose-6-phosphate 1-dehydrogenase